MALTVAKLAERAELDTRLLAGAAGSHREIGWAHVCELDEPWQWIGPGDLLMTTGLGIPADPAEQVAFVAHLADAGVAGVAVGEDMNAPPLSDRMLQAADDRGLPVLLTRRDVPFIALARAVAESSAEADRRRLEQTERVYEVLRASSTQDLSLTGMCQALADISGCVLHLLDTETGRSLQPGVRAPEQLVAAARAWQPGGPEDLPAVLPLPRGAGIAVAVPTPRPALLVAAAGVPGPDGRPAALPDPAVLRHMAAVIALDQTRRIAERERSLRLGSSLLAQLLDQRLGGQAAQERLAGADLPADGLVLAAVTTSSDRDDLHPLHHHLSDAGVAHLVLARPPLTYVLLVDDPRGIVALGEAIPEDTAVGLSDSIAGVGGLPAAQGQARWALRRAQERRLALVRHSDDLGDSVFLPADQSDSRAAALRVLGPLLEYDEAHGARLLESLRAFLEENRSWQRAAARMHVHKQTLVYRIRRVEELTDRDLADTADVADLWLALRAAGASGLLD